MGLKKILAETLGDDRTAAEKREDRYQRAEGMTTKGSSITRRAKERKQKADSSVVVPTPMGGGCLQRAGELLGITGVAVATIAAAVVGRARR